MKGHIFLKRSGSKYGHLWNELDNDYAKGDDKYTDLVQYQCQMMEHWKPAYVPKKDPVPKTENFLQNGTQGDTSNANKDVELSVDMLHINNIIFLGSISKNIHYVTINTLENMKIPTMESVIERIIHSYAVQGFHIALIHVDIQFKAIKDRKKIGMAINVVSKRGGMFQRLNG